jgi:hypothetical protein
MNNDTDEVSFKKSAAILYNICCQQVSKAIVDTNFNDSGPRYTNTGNQSYVGGYDVTGPGETRFHALKLAKHLLTCESDDIDYIARKYIPYDYSGSIIEGSTHFDSRVKKGINVTGLREWYQDCQLQTWALEMTIREWPKTCTQSGHILLATALGVGPWDEVYIALWRSAGKGLFPGGILDMAATMLFLYRLNQASPWFHNWNNGPFGGETRLDIRDVVLGYLHYVEKTGPEPPNPSRFLVHRFENYAKMIVSRYIFNPGGYMSRKLLRNWNRI